ncbi:MAG: SpoIIE family protein phosphatase [Candidatus Zixiibacteriota bacterium]
MATVYNWESQIEQLEARLGVQKAQLCDLTTMGAVITSIHEIDKVLSVVMDMAIRLVDGEVGLIMMEEEGELKPKISWGVSETFARSLKHGEQMDLPSFCFSSGQAIVQNDIGLRTEGIALNSLIALPIRTAEKCFGVMIIINKANGGPYNSQDQEILEMLLNFVAVAVDNALLMKETLRRQKVEQEMQIARQVQETILPQNLQAVEGVEIGSVYHPAREVGGDFYDIARLDNSSFVVLLGDVSNKGVPAALVMSAASGIIRSLLCTNPAITMAELAGALNDLLASSIVKDREMYVTLFLARVDVAARTLSYCNAGHLPGLFWDSTARQVRNLAAGGPIVGQFPGCAFIQEECQLRTGDRLFLFTDGLTEAADIYGQLFGRERAEQAFVAGLELAPSAFCQKMKETVDAFSKGAPDDTHDDFTVLQVWVK